MDVQTIVTTARDWLSENWTDLGVLLLTVCNFSSFVIKKVYSWRLKKNDGKKTYTFGTEGQTDISQDGEEHEGNKCNAESDERGNQIMSIKVSGLSSVETVKQSAVLPSKAVVTTEVGTDELIYKIKGILSKSEISNDSKVEVLKFILEVE